MTDVTETGIYNSRYEIIRQVARGGMAEVYLARDLQLHRSVALKVLFRELSTDQNFVQRFRHEAQAAANLSHPNIVSVYDWGESEADNTYFIVMEYVDGEPLSKTIRSRGPLDSVEAAEIGAAIASGLAFAHSRGVIHRDVKPGNVIVTSDGVAKVTDFGIARAHNSDMSLTQTGAVMGTATYFSPEQAQGERVDARSDIYSLAVVLYEMVTGKPPFTGDNPIAIATKHVRDLPPPPTEVEPSVPEAFEAIVMKAMSKAPEDRYQSAEELHDDLDRFVAGEGVSAPAYDPSVTAFFDQGAATIVSPEKTRRTRVADPTKAGAAGDGLEPPARSGARVAAWSVGLVLAMAVLGLGAFFAVRGVGTGGGGPQFDVPNVVKMTLANAETKLRAVGLTVKVVRTASAEAPSTVVDQKPQYPAPVSRGDTVTLYVSKGGQVAVPDEVGESVDAAQAALKRAGFAVTVVKKTIACNQVGQSPSPPNIGNVLAQKPSGTSAATGSTVTLTVSQGIAVPNVVGQSSSAASNVLGQCGLSLGTTTSSLSPPSQSVPNGNVLSTDPAPGTLVNPGDTVSLVVSSGTGVSVPNVVGESLCQAEADLTSVQLNYSVKGGSVSECTKGGSVTAQNPAAGTVVATGSTVSLTIQSAPTTTTTTSSSSSSSTTSTSGISIGGGGPGSRARRGPEGMP